MAKTDLELGPLDVMRMRGLGVSDETPLDSSIRATLAQRVSELSKHNRLLTSINQELADHNSAMAVRIAELERRKGDSDFGLVLACVTLAALVAGMILVILFS